MTTRTWTARSPEPTPWPTVVDEHGVTWRPMDDDGLGYLSYHQQKFTHLGNGAVTGGLCGNDWRDLWEHLPEGDEVREATTEEANTWTETWAAEGGSGGGGSG